MKNETGVVEPRCCLCSGKMELVRAFPRSVTSESRVIDQPSSLLGCVACGHLMSALAIDWADYYRTQYDATLTDGGADEIVTTADGSIVFRTDLDFGLFRDKVLAHQPKDARIFEFGAGHGRIVSRAHDAGFRDYAAYDLGERYAESLAKWLPPDRIHIGSRPLIQVDLVCSFFVLEHDVDPLGSLRYMRSLLQPGGLAYLVVPNFESNPADLACADHVQHFHPERFAALVLEAGFSVTEIDTTSAVGTMIVVAEAITPTLRAPRAAVEAVRETVRSAIGPFNELCDRLEVVTQRVTAGESVVLYGAGFYSTLLYSMLGPAKLEAVLDANPRKHGIDRFGVKVAGPDSVTDALADSKLLVCVNPAISRGIGRTFEGAFRAVECL